MNSDYPSSSPRGRRRRGGRRRRFSDQQPERAAQPTFWQRILSIFKRTKKPAQKSAPDTDRRPLSDSPRLVRRPEIVDVTTPRLYVGNLSFDATEHDLTELFKGVGMVASAEVVAHRQTQRSKGFAFVQMQTVEEAQRAVRELHDKPFMGRKLVVSGAKAFDQREAA